MFVDVQQYWGKLLQQGHHERGEVSVADALKFLKMQYIKNIYMENQLDWSVLDVSIQTMTYQGENLLLSDVEKS